MANKKVFNGLVANWKDIEDGSNASYPGSRETHGLTANFAKHFKLSRLGVSQDRLRPGERSSWPHAEADEEEFVLVLEGTPDLWVDGHIKRLAPGDCVGFASGTGLAHTFINNTNADVRMIVVGEASRYRSRIHYPMHPKRNAEIGSRHWSDVPKRKLGPHDGKPDKPRYLRKSKTP
ncbi:MAG: cupin domain-containing protein [Alphaproteobacteria bacterium]|nr:cupin domain-containing protein [Alphaproteobacteria bacterium]